MTPEFAFGKGGNMKSACAYLAAGLGIGAALSVFFAPRSGEETRKWVANKCFDAIDGANGQVWRSRLHVTDIMNRGQRQISQAVAAGRESSRRQHQSLISSEKE
jgi:gas vesicle protein